MDGRATDLLLGALALQMQYIRREDLFDAVDDWVSGGVSLGVILVGRGFLSEETLGTLKTFLDRRVSSSERQAADPLVPRASVWAEMLGGITDGPDNSLGDTRSYQSGGTDLEPANPARSPDLTRDDRPGASTQLAASCPAQGETTLAAMDRYLVRKPLASGGLGEVSIALDRELGRDVALKRIQSKHINDPMVRARFVFEAEVTGGLEHPGIVPIYSLAREGLGGPAYAMRLIRGESLADVVKKLRSNTGSGLVQEPSLVTERRRLVLRFLDICNALAYAHSRGVIHRDLKPANIMLGPFGESLLVDWGLARVVTRAHAEPGTPADQPVFASIEDAYATLPGSMLGTPAFMSPEQADGDLQGLGPRSDVYGLGATLYHILTGRPPIDPAPLPDMIEAVKSAKYLLPRALDPTIPRGLEAICLKAMALRPEDRYESASALASDLERWLADEPITAWREPLPIRMARWAKRHRPLVAGVVSLLVTGLVALAVGVVMIDQERRQTTRQRDLAQINYRDAREAVNDLLVDLADHPEIRRADGSQPIRKLMLERGRDYLSGFLERRAQMADSALDRDAANGLVLLGKITEEIDSKEKAYLVYQRADNLYAGIPDSVGEIAALRPHVWRRLGSLSRDLDRRNEAESYLKQAREALEASLARREDPDTRRELAATLVDQALLLRATEGSDQVLAILAGARKQLDMAAESKTNAFETSAELADLLDTIGVIEMDLARLDDSAKSLEQAERARARLYQQFPNNTEVRDTYAETLQHLGDLWIKRRDFAQALKLLEQARRLRQLNFERNPTVSQFRSDLARSETDMGVALHVHGDIAKAAEFYARANQLATDAIRLNPTDVQAEIEYVRSENNLAAVEPDINKKITRLESLLAHQLATLGESKNLRLRGYLAMTRSNLILFHRLKKNYQVAAQLSRQAIADQVAVLAEAPAIDQSRNNLDTLYANQTDVLIESKDLEGALEATRSRLPLGPDTSDRLVRIAGQFARMASLAPGDERFVQNGVSTLRRAIASGLNPSTLAADRRFAPLKRSPLFQQLLAEPGKKQP